MQSGSVSEAVPRVPRGVRAITVAILLAAGLSLAAGQNAQDSLVSASVVRGWGPETPLASDDRLVTRSGGINPGIATDGESYLVVWSESRGLRAARFDGDGRLLDPFSLSLGDGFGQDGPPMIAGNGQQWLILRDPFGAAPDPPATLLANGLVTNVTTNVRDGAVVTNGRNFLVYSTRGPSAAAIVNGSADVIPVTPAALPDRIHGAASNGTVYCLAGADGHSVTVNFIDGYGRAAFNAPQPLLSLSPIEGFSVTDLGLARANENFLALWLEVKGGTAGYEWALRSVEFTAAAALVGEPKLIREGSEPDRQGEFYDHLLRVSQSDAGEALVQWWVSPYRLYATPLSCPSGATQPGPAGSLASNGRTILNVRYSTDFPRSTLQVRSTALQCDVHSIDDVPPVLPNRSGVEQTEATVVGANDAALVYWWDDESRPSIRKAARFSLDGRPLGGMRIPDDARSANFVAASDGRDFVGVWETTSATGSVLRAARIVPEAGAPAPINAQIETGVPAENLSIAWNGRYYLITWAVSGPQGASVRMARMSADATLLDPMGIDVLTLPSGRQMRALTVSAGASETLLVWNEVVFECSVYGCDDDPKGVRALRVTAEGQPIGSSFEMVAGDPSWHRVVWSAPYWFAFWPDGDGMIQGRRLREGTSVPDAPRDLDLPDRYWGVEAVRAGHGVALLVEAPVDCYWCDESGGVFDANLNWTQPVSGRPPGLRLSAAPGLPGQLLVTYQRRVSEAPFNDVYRVFARAYSFVPPPPGQRGRAVRH